jgi:hypothetical protein
MGSIVKLFLALLAVIGGLIWIGWSLTTWLCGTLIFCGIAVWISRINLNTDHRISYMTDPPLEFAVKIFENKVQKHHEIKLICGVLACFCVVTFFLFR